MSGRDSGTSALDAALARLATHVEPPRDLWPGIRDAIECDRLAGNAAELGRALPEDVAPPADLWPAIRRGIAGAATRESGPTVSAPPVPSRPGSARRDALRVWGTAGVGVAATLVVGIVIGRWSALEVGTRGLVGDGADRAAAARRLPLPAEVAASEHMQHAETLLLLFESAPATGGDLAESAEVLAARTRLLIDSRIGEDPEARSILLELEYFLMQIARLDEASDPTERELTRESIQDSTIVAQLRQLRPEPFR